MSKVAIYGTGIFGKLFLDTLDGDIDCFIDDFNNAKSYENRPIKQLKSLSKDIKIYISPLQYSSKIEMHLIEKGFTNIINFTNAIKTLPNILELISQTDYLWLISDKQRMVNEEKLKQFESLLTDTKSKEILKKIINLRKSLNPKFYIEPTGTEYFPDDIPILKNLDTINFIDCGAYTGDTIEELCNSSKPINSTISFEPDHKNLLKLEDTLSRLQSQHPKTQFFLYPAGVYSHNCVLNFANNGIDSSAAINENATTQIPVVSLDSVILNSNPNFIKMDIEGAEKEALLGAKKTIQKHKPNLAICLYHKPEDLWELPLLIQDIEPSYDMYIRVHEDMCLSTVLYCISRS